MTGEGRRVVLVGQGALSRLSQLRHDDRSPPGDGAPRAADGTRPALQALLVAGALQRPGVGHHVQRVHSRERPAWTADDGAHVVLFGASGGRAGVILERGALGEGGEGSGGVTTSGTTSLSLSFCAMQWEGHLTRQRQGCRALLSLR